MMNNILYFFIAEKVGLLMERRETTEADTERRRAASEGAVLARRGDPQSDPDRATSIQLITAAAAANEPGWTIARRTAGVAPHPRQQTALGTFPRRQPPPRHGASGIRPAGRRQKRPPPPVRTREQRSAASPPRLVCCPPCDS
jgi:hypothetical protein